MKTSSVISLLSVDTDLDILDISPDCIISGDDTLQLLHIYSCNTKNHAKKINKK